ncbi:MAG: 6-carboxytetrahydropterin synthase [Methanomicrobiales archaeon]|nr:6-carboxytetrahydropterin synthase [Methanomicrobiales archaeon]
MRCCIYKEVFFDASHRLLHYEGKCRNLHGHRWRVEVWIEGETDEVTRILMDYNLIKTVIERFDHQVILNETDPMVDCLTRYQTVITTPGDPSSEMISSRIWDMLCAESPLNTAVARLTRLRVWESPSCCAEITHAGQ